MPVDFKVLLRKAIPALERKAQEKKARDLHAWINSRADVRHDNMVAQDPTRALSAATEREIIDYSRDVLGSEIFAPWLRTFSVMQRQFHPGWLPDNYVSQYMVPHLVGEHGARLDRVRAARTLNTDLFPDLLYRQADRLILPDGSDAPPDRLSEIIFARGDLAYLKLNGTGRGEGVTVLNRADFHPAMLPTDRDFVVQFQTRHDPDLNRFSPVANISLRITSVMTPTGPETRCARLQLGRAGDQFVQAASSAHVLLDLETGEFFEQGTFGPWTLCDAHPDTGEVFRGARLNGLGRMRACCEALHAMVPEIGWLGWDICPQAGGAFSIYEVNAGHAGIVLMQGQRGPVLSDLGWDRLHLIDQEC